MENKTGHNRHNHRPGGDGAVTNIKVAFALNLGFTLVEAVGGFLTNSVAILSNALHDLGDSLSLGLAWYFQKVSNKKGDSVYSFGYKRFSLLGAVINSMVLVIGSMLVLNETLPRLFKPETTDVRGMLLLAIFGVLVNGAAVLRLKKGSSLNEKVVSLHLIEDVFGWAVILTGSVVMTFVYLPVLDPVLSVLITLYVLFNVFKNLKTSIPIFLQAVPNHTNIELIKEKILQMPGITGVHDIHTWTLDGEYNILSIHLILKEVDNLTLIQSIKEQVRHLLTGMEIHHITIETEREDDDCHLRDCPG